MSPSIRMSFMAGAPAGLITFLVHCVSQVADLTDEADPAMGLRALAKDAAGQAKLADLLGAGGVASQALATTAIMCTLAKADLLLDQIVAGVENLQESMSMVLKNQEKILLKLDAAHNAPPPAMPPFMVNWWNKTIAKLRDKVSSARFLEKVVNWFKAEG